MKPITNWSKSSLNSFCWKSLESTFSTCFIVWFIIIQCLSAIIYTEHYFLRMKILSPIPQISDGILKKFNNFNDPTRILQHELLSLIYHRISNNTFKHQYEVCRIWHICLTKIKRNFPLGKSHIYPFFLNNRKSETSEICWGT